jgi:MFS family permease
MGRRPLLVFGPLVTLAAALLAAASSEVWQLILLRLVSGIGMGAFMTGSIVLLSDIDDEAERLSAIGLFRAAVILGVLTGPIAGGAVAQVGGYRLAFFLQAAVCAAASLWCFLRVPVDSIAHDRSRASQTTWLTDMRAVLRNRNLVLVGLVTFNVFFTLTGARQAIVPLLAEDRFGVHVGGLGVLFALISFADLLSLWPASRLGRRFGPKPVIVASGGAFALSLVAFAGAHSMAQLFLGGFLMGVGSGLASPTTASYAASVAPASARGSAMGTYQAIGDSGFVIGPLLLGGIASLSGLGAGLLANAGLAILVSVVFALAATSGRRGEGSGRPVERSRLDPTSEG